MISPEESSLSLGAYGAFAISEAFLYRTKVPECKLFALYQFQEWMKRQNGNAVVTEEPDSPDKMSRGYSFEDPSFFDDTEVSFVSQSILAAMAYYSHHRPSPSIFL